MTMKINETNFENFEELKELLKLVLKNKEEFPNYKEIPEFLELEEDLFLKLNEEFANAYEEYEDAQVAFNYLNEILDGKLSEEFVYSLSDGGEWTLCVEEKTQKPILKKFFETFKVKNIGDLEATLTKKIEKTMSNVGCDAKTAFDLEKEDFPIEDVDEFIYVDVPNGNPCLSYIDDLF